MTGTIASISVPAPPPGLAAMLSAGAPKPGAGAGATPSLAAFVDLMLGKASVPDSDSPAGERQDDAGPGNSLPEDKPDQLDPALAWLFPVAPVTLPVVGPIAPRGPNDDIGAVAFDPDAMIRLPATEPLTPAAGATAAQPVIEPGLPLASAKPDLPQGPAVGIKPAVSSAAVATTIATLIAANDPKAGTPVDTVSVATPATVSAKLSSIRDDAAPAVQPARTVPLALPIVPQAIVRSLTANAPLLASLALAGRDRDEARDGDTPASPGAAMSAALLQPADATTLIAKPGEAQRQALDMGRQDWPQKMIDRIEALRDDANANDTSIRLKPEALGRIDVSLRTHADGAVTVRFAAEQPATRALIAEAQPQLQAAAEARGIRLSGTSVDLSGSGAGAERQQTRFELQQNISNHLATGEDKDAVGDDGRIA